MHVLTKAEGDAGVTPANPEYPPGDVRRYGAMAIEVAQGSGPEQSVGTGSASISSESASVGTSKKESADFPSSHQGKQD